MATIKLMGGDEIDVTPTIKQVLRARTRALEAGQEFVSLPTPDGGAVAIRDGQILAISQPADASDED